MNETYAGIDVGTQGVRVLVVDARGNRLADGSRSWGIPDLESDYHEQDANVWWASLLSAADEVFESLSLEQRGRLAGVAVASTSGSLLVCDQQGDVLRHAILHSDRRAKQESKQCNEASRADTRLSGLQYRSTFSLPKLLWLRANEPEIWRQTRHALHPADWLTSRLSGVWGESDETNVLKMGYDLVDNRWPDYLSTLGVPREILPRVGPSGRPVGRLLPELSRRWKLPDEVVVAAGITDSNAVHLSSGSVGEGEWTTTIGTAMGIKGIVKGQVADPGGSFYCHRHPDGLWILGGASNVGGAALNRRFGLDLLTSLEREFPQPRHTSLLVYPLEGVGDWFPMWWPEARRFESDEQVGSAEQLLATYEGIAFIERLAYDRLVRMGLSVQSVTAAGGTIGSAAFLAIRAALLPCPLRTVENCCAAKGAAMLAAMASQGKSLAEIAPRMVRPGSAVVADLTDRDYLEDKYREFVAVLNRRFSGPRETIPDRHADTPHAT